MNFNIILLIVATAILILAYCIKYFNALKDATKKESIQKFFSDTLTGLGLALVVGVITVTLFQRELLKTKLEKYPSDISVVESILKDPFRMEDAKIVAIMNPPESHDSIQRSLYEMDLVFYVKNISDAKKYYQFKYGVSSLISENPNVSIHDIRIFPEENGELDMENNLLKGLKDIVKLSEKNGLWQAETNIPEIPISAKNRLRIEMKLFYEDHLNNGMQIFGVRHFCKNLDFKIKYDSTAFNIDLFAWPSNNELLTITKSENSNPNGKNKTKECFIRGTLYPSQGVFISYLYVPNKEQQEKPNLNQKAKQKTIRYKSKNRNGGT